MMGALVAFVIVAIVYVVVTLISGGLKVFSFFASVPRILIVFVLVYGAVIAFGKDARRRMTWIAVATISLSPLWLILWYLTREAYGNYFIHKGVEACTKDLARLPQTFNIDSLLDETNGLGADDLIYLLEEARLRFVEIKLMPEKYVNDSRVGEWVFAKNSGYVHLELGEAGSPDCFYDPKKKPGSFFTSNPPVKPGACLHVTYPETPSAEMTLTDRSGKNDGFFSTWVLKKTANGAEIASIRDVFRKRTNFDSSGPDRIYRTTRPFWNRQIRAKQNDCFGGLGGYGILLERLRGSPAALSAADRWLMTRKEIVIDKLPSVKEVGRLQEQGKITTLHSVDYSFDGGANTVLRDNSTWEKIYAAGLDHGIAMYEGSLINPGANVIYSIKDNGFYGVWGYTATQLIFVSRNHEDEHGLSVFGVDFNGRLRWLAQTAPLTPRTKDASVRFRAERLELTKDALLVYGFSYAGKEPFRPWIIQLPLAELNALGR